MEEEEEMGYRRRSRRSLWWTRKRKRCTRKVRRKRGVTRKRGKERREKEDEKEEQVGKKETAEEVRRKMMMRRRSRRRWEEERGEGEKKGMMAEEEEEEEVGEVEPLLCHFYCQIKVINLAEACDGRLREIYIGCVWLHYSSHTVAFDLLPSPPFHLVRLQPGEHKIPYLKTLTEATNFSYSRAAKNKLSSRSAGSEAAATHSASRCDRAAQELN